MFINMINLFLRRRILVLRLRIVIYFFITKRVLLSHYNRLKQWNILTRVIFLWFVRFVTCCYGLFFVFFWDKLETGWWRGKIWGSRFSYFQKGVTKQCFQEGETKLAFILCLLVYIISFSYIVMTTRSNGGAKPRQI